MTEAWAGIRSSLTTLTLRSIVSSFNLVVNGLNVLGHACAPLSFVSAVSL